MSRTLRSGALAVALAAIMCGTVLGTAPSPGITRGEVEAIFQARTTANQIQAAHLKTASAVRQGFLRGRISPFFNSHPFCSSDWLILLVSEGATTTYRDSVAYRARLGVGFTLDGQAVTTRQTALKRFLTVPPAGDFWGWTVAHIYAPGTLTDGDHALVTTTTFDGTVIEVFPTTFTVGSGPTFCD